MEYVLNTSDVSEFAALTRQLNENPEVEIVLVQHEFGLYAEQEEAFLQMLEQLRKPVILVFILYFRNQLWQCTEQYAEWCLPVRNW